MIPAVAKDALRTVAGLSCALAVVGVVLMIGSAAPPAQASWSSPVRGHPLRRPAPLVLSAIRSHQASDVTVGALG